MLDHVTLRTHDLEGTRAFLEAVLGLKPGYRPAFTFSGYWLYADGEPVVHLIPGHGGAVDRAGESVDHVAFRLTDHDGMRRKLDGLSIPYWRMELPEIGERRLFIRTPTGILLELVFREGRATPNQSTHEEEGGSTLKQQAVLFRTSHHSGPLEIELTRRNIPFVKFGGLKFLDAAHIKDLLALLRFVENPRDRIAGFRLLQLMQGVGPASAQRVLDHMMTAADPIGSLVDAPSPPRAGDDWRAFVAVMADMRSGRAGWPAELERARLWYEPHLERIHEDAVTRQADLIQLEQIASGYPSRQRFLTELTLDPPDATSDQAGVPLVDEDYLILSTIHSAKGQEWKSVFVLNVVDGCIPSDLGTGTTAEIEEERRLLYVAMTRAKDDPHLIVPQRFFTHGQSAQGDRHVYASRTRFIPNGLVGLFEKAAWPAMTASSAAPVTRQGARIDIGARMRKMWQ